MTRDEAIKVYLRHFPSLGSNAEAVIKFYVDLGLLKLDEPKSAEERAMDALRPWWGMGRERNREAIFEALKRANLEIVDRQDRGEVGR